jgi:UDP-N-acetylmuramoyl-L-alanyl-D-glutamate--2,6-diaminopimelate ligase
VTLRPEGTRVSGGDLRALLGLPPGPPDHVDGVTLDSRRVRPGDLYAALPGFSTHGARFAAQAVDAGAAAILTDPAGAALVERAGGVPVPVLVVEDPRGRLGEVADWLFGHPSRRLRTTGITGTNGKTTTSYLLDAALRAGGLAPTGIIGTVAIHIGDERVTASRTTPEAPDLHALLAVMVRRGVRAVTLEVSSHALALGRVDGVVFDLAVFTNLSQDHLDFHGTIDEYFAAKAALFTAERARAALVCIDDGWGVRMAQHARAAGLPTQTLSVEGSVDADWRADGIATEDGSGTFTLLGPGGVRLSAAVPLPGRFNVANGVAAIAAAVHQGIEVDTAVEAVRASEGVPGRMQRAATGDGVVGIVDYAHTPDAVERAIAAARETYDGRVIVVLGCGGDRDRQKRPLMGRVAAQDADVLVITDDNPRSEAPGDIRAAIMVGVFHVEADHRAEVREEGDRHEAIRLAVAVARPGDVVLVLGKGHEVGQERAGQVTPFDDVAELRAALGSRP